MGKIHKLSNSEYKILSESFSIYQILCFSLSQKNMSLTTLHPPLQPQPFLLLSGCYDVTVSQFTALCQSKAVNHN